MQRSIRENQRRASSNITDEQYERLVGPSINGTTTIDPERKATVQYKS